MCGVHMSVGACGVQKMALDPLKLELQAIVTRLTLVLGTEVLCKSSEILLTSH